MREIKFRAWDKKKKEMTGIFDLGSAQGFNGDYTFSNACIGPIDVDAYIKGRYIIMQYTGLKDDDGKEIYEGDIIRCEFWACDCVVEWGDGGFILREGETTNVLGYELEISTDGFYYNVIGNIYENPKLLEEWRMKNEKSSNF